MRVGIGFDAHRFTSGRPLFLGGVKIPYDRGLEGHSDGDVVIHALCDALLGAAGKDDIGTHFPDTDKRYEGISSLFFLSEVAKVLEREKKKLVNVDIIVVLEEPRLSPYKEEMRKQISKALKVGAERINIKATTTEKMGFTGRGEGIAAYSAVLIDDLEKEDGGRRIV